MLAHHLADRADDQATLGRHMLGPLVDQMNMWDHRRVAQRVEAAIMDRLMNSPAEIAVVTLDHHPAAPVVVATNTRDRHLVAQSVDVATLAPLTNSPAGIMVATLVLHPLDPVVAEMTTRGHRLVDRKDDAAILFHLTNSPAGIMVATSVLYPSDPVADAMIMQDPHHADPVVDAAILARHRADLVADGVHKLDDCLMGPVDDPKDDLAISGLLANEPAEIVVQTLAHLPEAPVMDEVIKAVRHDVDQKIMIAVDQAVIATRNPNDLLDEMLEDRIY